MHPKLCAGLLFGLSAMVWPQTVATNQNTAPKAASGNSGSQSASRKPRTTAKKPAVRRFSRKRTLQAPVRIYTAEMRLRALRFVESGMTSKMHAFENPDALQPFFRRLTEAQRDKKPIHILQYGDSHTASDDWANAMRLVFQQTYGDGGPGFTVAGHPYKGYRRFDVTGTSSPGWITKGIVRDQGDGRNGLAGVSITTQRPHETATLTTSGERVQIEFLEQPGGGSFTLSSDGSVAGTISTDGPLASQSYSLPTNAPGTHTYTVETTSYSPVRLLGWTAENDHGATWETLGINGAQAKMLLDWDSRLWTEELQQRDPALVVIAYGTNEAVYPLWEAQTYRSQLLELVERFKTALPNSSFLLVGPPNCGRRVGSFPHLQEVIAIQKEVAHETDCAFWDWESRMDASGGRERWVQAGLSQPDYTHLTPDGYRMLGATLANEILLEYRSAVPGDLDQSVSKPDTQGN